MFSVSPVLYTTHSNSVGKKSMNQHSIEFFQCVTFMKSSEETRSTKEKSWGSRATSAVPFGTKKEKQ